MPQYIIAYRNVEHAKGQSPMPETPEAQAAQKQAWGDWANGLGDAAVDRGTPMMGNKMVLMDGSVVDAGPNGTSGFTIVEAPDMDAALAMAKGCPFLQMGNLEVAQLMQFKG